jgi:hypothetical protein
MSVLTQKLLAGAMAALGITCAVPIPMAGFDFAGMWNIFGIDHGDTPQGVITLVVVAAVLTTIVLVVAAAGVALILLESPAARPVLLAAAIAGLVTAMPAWLPTGLLLGFAAHLSAREAGFVPLWDQNEHRSASAGVA